ncbi:MAG: enoyl-CoA hydratase/isomerase family protein [Bergeyella sp.]|nr:enoyl-CoA hydratase/isomerase family protein [Bergeyella sp.]
MDNKGSLDLQIDKGIAVVAFAHPKGNSLPGNLLEELAKTISAVGREKVVRVIVLKSKGEQAFCAGASFDELLSIRTKEESVAFFSGFARVINAMRKTSQFVIAEVQGKVVGGGVGLIAAADYVFAVQEASLRLSELGIGIGPFVIGPAVERKVGVSAFSEMTLKPAEFFSAKWAKDKGLYQEVFSTCREMSEAVKKFSATLSAYHPEAMKRIKRVFWEGTSHWDRLLMERAKMSGELVLTDFSRKIIESFR